MPAADVWRALKSRAPLKEHSTGWLTKCPAHEDPKASLSVRKSDNGNMLLYCQAGCVTKDVVEALGLRTSDLFALSIDRPKRKEGPRIVATYDYIDEDGVLLYQSVRYEPKDFRLRRPDGDGWIWGLDEGTRKVLYRLPEMIESHPSVPVFLCEGEKDVDNLRALDIVAVAFQGGSAAWREVYAKQLDGRHVVVLPDNDKPGLRLAADVQASIPSAVALRLFADAPLQGQDVTNWIEKGGTRNRLINMVQLECRKHTEIAEDNFAYWRVQT